MATNTPLVCFVVCPMGKPGSEHREYAETLINHYIRYSVEPLNFRVESPLTRNWDHKISDELIKTLREADLCIIDISPMQEETGGSTQALSRENGNVYYEFGIRYESRKPYILICKEGTKDDEIAFDIRDLPRTHYNLLSVKAGGKSIEILKDRIHAMMNKGLFEKTTAEIPLYESKEKLDKLEQLMNQVLTEVSNKNDRERPGSGMNNHGLTTSELFVYYVKQDRVEEAAMLLPKLKTSLKDNSELIAAASWVSEHQAGITILLEFLQRFLDGDITLTLTDQKRIISDVVQYFDSRGIGNEIKDVIDAYLTIFEQNEDLSIRDTLTEAYFLNQFAKFYTDLDVYFARKFALKANKLDPNDASYLYNLSIIDGIIHRNLVESNQHEEAENMRLSMLQWIDKYTALGSRQIAHLARAVEVYNKHNQIEKMLDSFQKLIEVSPQKAYVLAISSEINQNLPIEIKKVLGV